ncbi:flagellin [Sulfurivirga caldicuralii]|uniref:Flagellin n=1 Tax=Sulfurivirga caldicuralii TaxID=364032 RepID=A0A1N6GYI4_9GAMM|nr:flagellin [Sulfurivirga caldicuralii]SIO12445.1 flagellin [Sulfurivirga caldicuralii]
MITLNDAYLISNANTLTPAEQLTSGKRINHTADDAAGAAIVQIMTAQIRGQDLGYRNAHDGISLVQTADGALEGYTAGLQRMRELAVQSANGTLNAAERQAVQAEFDQIREELGRVAESTQFNGRPLLKQAQQVNIQLGESGTAINLPDARPQTLGIDTLDISNPANALNAINGLDTALETLTKSRAEIGAKQNALTHAADNLANTRLNTLESRSQISDADMARAFAELTRNRILEQAHIAMLSHRNHSQADVLNLLS